MKYECLETLDCVGRIVITCHKDVAFIRMHTYYRAKDLDKSKILPGNIT